MARKAFAFLITYMVIYAVKKEMPFHQLPRREMSKRSTDTPYQPLGDCMDSKS
jgi:hypothetical protein